MIQRAPSRIPRPTRFAGYRTRRADTRRQQRRMAVYREIRAVADMLAEPLSGLFPSAPLPALASAGPPPPSPKARCGAAHFFDGA